MHTNKMHEISNKKSTNCLSVLGKLYKYELHEIQEIVNDILPSKEMLS